MGERCVGQTLERLRSKGYQVFHDIPCGGFNIDHVLISPRGVFVIDTKTYTRPAHGRAEVIVSDSGLMVGTDDRSAMLSRVKGQARWLHNFIHQETAQSIWVMAVIVFPGWEVITQPGTNASAWVLNPRDLPQHLTQQPENVGQETVRAVTHALGNYCREKNRSL